tara:strand:- start:251 stop:1285 length:1035 start_codon:yes stop_codon:yes gene_type:complete
MSQKKKIVILSHGSFNYIKNKTGNMLIRYRTDEVIALLDRTKSGMTANDELGYGGNIPVLDNFDACIDLEPDTLVIGNASQGGFISDDYRAEVIKAIEFGCDIISGMHHFINDDVEFVQLAEKHNVSLFDLRRPPDPPNFPKGSWHKRKIPVLLIVGTDCDTGKMTTAWEVSERLKSRGRKVEFIGTGQTGILLSGAGVPIDAVKADFMAGEIEHLIDKVSEDTELIIVEGQGALTNQYYAGVTLGLLHGAMPDYMLMTHDPARDLDVTDYPMATMRLVMDMHLDLMSNFKKSKFIGINLLTFKLSDEDAKKEIDKVKEEYSMATTDLIRYGSNELIETIEDLL